MQIGCRLLLFARLQFMDLATQIFSCFFQCIKKGILPLIGNPQRQLSLVYVKDLVGGIHAAAVSDRAVGETYFLTDGVVHSWRDVAQTIACELKKRPFPLRAPFFLLDVVSIFTEAIARFYTRTCYLESPEND